MLAILSPSKTQDFSHQVYNFAWSVPRFSNEIAELTGVMRHKTKEELRLLMDISDKLASLNYERYQQFAEKFSTANSKPAILSFKGDVYDGMDVQSYNQKDFDFAQRHLRILSGLYGLLRPLDLMQPYRLEMGIKLKTDQGRDLYQFWGDKITDMLNLDESGCLINLASAEYFSAINISKLKSRLINIVFHEANGKIVGLFAKRARGMMANYIIKNQLDKPDSLKEFNESGYRFSNSASDNANYIFSK